MRLLDDSKRYFNGIVNRFSQGARDETFNHFRADIVPKFWLLTKKVRSRIFQHLSVPDILNQVLVGFDVSYEMTGTYYQRDYCVQYRESDFDFASRLMEEEGIYYFFNHSDGNHQMMVSDNTTKHPTVSGQSTAIYEVAIGRCADRYAGHRLGKNSGTALRRMHAVGPLLRAARPIIWKPRKRPSSRVPVGKVVHKLNLANDTLEIYDYPGRYAQRFDGIDPSGGDRPSDIAHIFEDRDQHRPAAHGAGRSSGHPHRRKKRLRPVHRRPQVHAGTPFRRRRCLSADARRTRGARRVLSQRPAGCGFVSSTRIISPAFPKPCATVRRRVTPVPEISGMQTATVVGPPGEEIWVDKYGRVKVQFHWDREGKMNADSSCWVRVSQVWAGKGWGAFFWPRIGHEVVVIFEEGDPDQPLIIGSVYNADNMPWYNLPINKELGGIKSASERGTSVQNFNAVVFCDKKGKEHLAIHSERNLTMNAENDKQIQGGRHKGERVGVANMLTTGKMIPSGGGSGGANFNAGNPITNPAPVGFLGLNSQATFGVNQQVACPINHQLVVGSNYQVCLNPLGLLAGIPGAGAPQFLEGLLGGGLGGSMQYTVGASAQFTLGQSFELSVGPPKIESHAGYKEHAPTIILCGVLSIAQLVFVLAYDLMVHSEEQSLKSTYPNEDYSDATYAGSEQSGDNDRAGLSIAYQLLSDVVLSALITCECFLWKPLEDTAKKADYTTIFGTAVPEKPEVDWAAVGGAATGAFGISAVVLAELAG